MSDEGRFTDDTNQRLKVCLSRLAAGDSSARGDLIGLARDRMMGIAHRMLRTFPSVRRWDQTDDVVQNASLRLERALIDVMPHDVGGFIGLAAVQIRRELLDLARKHTGPESYAANHETNVQRVHGQEKRKIDDAPVLAPSNDELARWTRLHEVVDILPDEERKVFHLAWYMGLKQQEIADLLGYGVRTVKRRWESAKRLIAEAMEREPPE